MKKIKKNLSLIIAFFVGLIISFLGTTYAASQILAADVDFSPRDVSWKVDNAEAAINDLYYKVPGVPTGTVLSIMGNTAPAGYVICDGTEYNIESHSNLAEYIKEQFGSYNYFGGDGETTFAVPDLRGEFLRGTGTNSHANQGNGSNVGIHQNATNHVYFGINTSAPDVWFPASGTYSHESSNQDSIIYNANKTGRSASLYNTWNGTGNGHYTSRPTNTSVLYIIKY